MDKTELLDSSEEIKKIDKIRMLSIVEKMPEFMLEALAIYKKSSPLKIKGVEYILFSGMGGSAMAAEIAENLLFQASNIPSSISRNFKIPNHANKNTLFFALSYSGNTDETLCALKEAQKANTQIVCIASGGRLADIARNNNYPLYLVPAGYQPRAALPFMLVMLLKCLEDIGILPEVEKDIQKSAELLSKLKDEYGPAKALRVNGVKQLVKKMIGKTPIIFGSANRTDAAALRIKNQLNENSKVTALINNFPELDHNEIVNLAELRREKHNFILIFLRDDQDHERVQKGIEITKSLIGHQLGGVHEINAQGKSILSKILSLIYFGDFLSVYLAIQRGIDPTPVETIVRLKKELNR